MRAILAVVVGCQVAACQPSTPGAGPRAERRLDRDKLAYASLLARGRGLDDAEWARWNHSRPALTSLVDEMLDDPFLAEQAAPAIVFKHNLLRAPRHLFLGSYELSEATVDGERILHLGRPCRIAETIAVRPWWDLSTTVKVCKDSIRPATWTTRTKSGAISCGSSIAAPTADPNSGCGCGPNLLRCPPMAPDTFERFSSAALDEVRATTRHLVAADRPLAELFTTNATARSREIELLYLKSLAEGLQMTNPEPLLALADALPPPGTLAPRKEIEEGQHAGVLTAPDYLYSSMDPRQRMRMIYETMWCATESAPGALPEDLLSLHTADLSMANHGWQELAARPICTSCHARLDYGMQFFRGYPSVIVSAWHFVPGQARGPGPLYGSGIDDPRGTGTLTPRGFAEAAVAQPEFSRCMARNVAEYVFGPATTPATIDRLAALAPGQQLRFRALMRAALLEFLGCDSCAVPRRPAVAGAARQPELATLVGEQCVSCHFEGASIPSFEGRLDAKLAARMVDQVVSGRMPPTGEFPIAARLSFLRAAHRVHGWERTVGFLAGYTDPPAALPVFVARAYARQLSGNVGPVDAMNLLENALDGKDNVFSPNYAVVSAIEAYRDCAGAAGGRRRCAAKIMNRLWSLAP